MILLINFLYKESQGMGETSSSTKIIIYGVCHVRSGWLVVKEKTNITNLCEWDKHTTYPQFLYSQHGKVTRWIAKGTILKKASVVQHLYNVFSVTSKVYKYDPYSS